MSVEAQAGWERLGRSTLGQGLAGLHDAQVFLREAVPLQVPAPTAWRRMLVHLRLDGLQNVSDEAFGSGRQLLIRASGIGLSKKVQVQILPPYVEDGTMVVPVRWMATGPTGALFPQLDGNVEIARTSPEESLISLVGSYRPPLGDLGAGLDRAVLHRVAQSTFRGFLGDLRDALSAATPADDVDLDLENVLRK